MTEGVRGRQERGEQTGNLTVLASRWGHAVAGTSYVPLRPDEVEELLLTFVRRLVLATYESVTAARTVGVEVGTALVDAHFTNPRTLSQTVAVLLEGRPDAGDRGTGRPPGHTDGEGGCDIDQVDARWRTLVAGIAEGFSAALQERASGAGGDP